MIKHLKNTIDLFIHRYYSRCLKYMLQDCVTMVTLRINFHKENTNPLILKVSATVERK